ncbi:MAG: glycosyltransferase [Eubacteriales bacterium]
MKALILTITAGQGHNTCAKTIGDSLSAMGVEARVLDTYEYVSKVVYKAFSEGYLLSVKSKHIYSQGYKIIERRKAAAHSPMRTANKPLAHKLQKYIAIYNPDIIIYTHVMAGFILDILKEQNALPCKCMGILTDFTMHPYWDECLRSDYIVLPNHLVANKAMRKGFCAEQILDTGIPISPKFARIGNKQEIRTELGLDPGKRTILLMAGSMGYGNMGSIIKRMDHSPIDFQMISVCGSNSKMKAQIDQMNLRKPILNFGYTDRISDLMDASDCIVTKPGGLTSSEALAKRLPMIIANPIPGQEDRNTEFLMNCGVAMKTSDFQTIDELLFELFNSHSRLAGMVNAIDEIRRPNATEDLCKKAFEIAGK